MQASDRACFSGELRVERITASSLPRVAGHVSPYVRIVYVLSRAMSCNPTASRSPPPFTYRCPKAPATEEHSRIITDASDPAIWLAKDLPDSGFIAFESVPYVPPPFTFSPEREEG